MKEAIIQYNDDPESDGNYMVISWKEFVRCKDCKWNNGFTGCDKYLLPHGGDWFCADGERE